MRQKYKYYERTRELRKIRRTTSQKRGYDNTSNVGVYRAATLLGVSEVPV
jgi:hypothetical protein